MGIEAPVMDDETSKSGKSKDRKSSKDKDKPGSAATESNSATEAASDSGDASDATSTDGAGDSAETKKTLKRRSIWVAVPLAFEEVVGEDEEASGLKPSRWALHECEGGKGQKKAILDLLNKYEVDPTNFHFVKMFRGEVAFKASSQIVLRF